MNGDQYVIASDSERGWWSNADGWVCDIADATRFGEDEDVTFPLSADNDARWELVSFAY